MSLSWMETITGDFLKQKFTLTLTGSFLLFCLQVIRNLPALTSVVLLSWPGMTLECQLVQELLAQQGTNCSSINKTNDLHLQFDTIFVINIGTLIFLQMV